MCVHRQSFFVWIGASYFSLQIVILRCVHKKVMNRYLIVVLNCDKII